MKTTLKRIIAVILCAIIAIANAGANTAYAAGKEIPLKVTFNGASANLIKDLETSGGRGDTLSLGALEEKWGEPSKKRDDGIKSNTAATTTLMWKKGKTYIAILCTDPELENSEAGSITIDMKDKNGAVLGVKVGMKADKAFKILQKTLGKKKVELGKKKGYQIKIVKKISEATCIQAYAGPYLPIGIGLKNGKVSSIHFWRS